MSTGCLWAHEFILNDNQRILSKTDFLFLAHPRGFGFGRNLQARILKNSVTDLHRRYRRKRSECELKELITPYVAKESGLLASMGTVGDALDNAVVEAFWARMQVELFNRKKWRTRVELANAIFEYLAIFHNRQRRHSALAMHTPIEYEILHQTRQPAA